MKRIFTAALCAIAIFASCEESGMNTVSVTVEVYESKLESIKPESYEVVFTNTTTATATTATTENGIATANVMPGIYQIVVKSSVAEDGKFYAITGSMKDVNILTSGETYTITVDMVAESQLIFKEIYYTGSVFETGEIKEDGTPSTSNYFRDQFYEIYNNSDEVAYADGLCIFEIAYANYNYTVVYEFAFADGTPASKDEYVFGQNIWQIQGNGTDFPIQPGESIIIAQWATNHKDDKLTKGFSPVDLSGAEFEAVEEEKEAYGGIVLTDNAAHNMKLATCPTGYAPPQWLTSVSGTRMVLAKPSEPLRQDNWCVSSNTETPANYCEVKIADVLDAVQMIADESVVTDNHLGMPIMLDAGYIWCKSSYSAQSVSRKQAGTLANGSIKYADTNNTVDDFVVNDTPVIRRDGAKVPSWNTWIK